jgi:hypothetical protein
MKNRVVFTIKHRYRIAKYRYRRVAKDANRRRQGPGVASELGLAPELRLAIIIRGRKKGDVLEWEAQEPVNEVEPGALHVSILS